MRTIRVQRSRNAFTLIEMLVVIIIIAVLAAIVMPKFANRTLQSKEAALKSDLKLMRNAIQLFQTDTGAYPASLSALTASTAPATGVDSAGNSVTITASDWHGPYLQGTVPNDPVSGSALTYSDGTVTSSASGNSTAGTAYSTW